MHIHKYKKIRAANYRRTRPNGLGRDITFVFYQCTKCDKNKTDELEGAWADDINIGIRQKKLSNNA